MASHHLHRVQLLLTSAVLLLLCIHVVVGKGGIINRNEECAEFCAQYLNCYECAEANRNMGVFGAETTCMCGYCSKLNSTQAPACIFAPFGLRAQSCVGELYGEKLGRAGCSGVDACSQYDGYCDECTAERACGYCKSTEKCVSLRSAPSCTLQSTCTASDRTFNCSSLSANCAECLSYPTCYFDISGGQAGDNCTSTKPSGTEYIDYLTPFSASMCYAHGGTTPPYTPALFTVTFDYGAMSYLIALGLPAGAVLGLVLMGITSLVAYKVLKKRSSEQRQFEQLMDRQRLLAEEEEERAYNPMETPHMQAAARRTYLE